MNAFRFLIITSLVYCTNTFAIGWQSPVESQFEKAQPALFKDYAQAREILDNYGGRSVDFERAYELLSSLQEKDEDLAPVLREFGRLYIMAAHTGGYRFDAETLNAAEKMIIRSIEVAPQYEDAYVLLGHLYEIMEQYDRAIDTLSEAEALGSESVWLKLNLASVYIKTQRFDEAMILTQEVIDSNTSNAKAEASAFGHKRDIAWAAGDLSEVKLSYEELLSRQPDRAWSWGNYASFLLYSDLNPDGAIAAAEQALSLMNYEQARLTKGVALYTKWANIAKDKAREDEANKLYAEAISYYPNHDRIIQVAWRNHGTRGTAEALLAFLQWGSI